MIHPPDCPEWEYKDHAQKDETLSRTLPPILSALRKGAIDAQQVARDTRPCHHSIFVNLTPNGHDYYAGNYRGSDHRCLRYYPVGIGGDPLVGCAPDRVWDEMRRFTEFILAGIASTETANQLPRTQLSEREKLRFLIAFVAQIFVDFLTVHPYANGNGHIGRLLVWAILLQFGYRPQGWPIHPRPNGPGYLQMIFRHRRGEPEPLEKALVRHVLLGER